MSGYRAAMLIRGVVSIAALFGVMSAPARAELVKLEILSRQSPAFDGRVFGDVGTYEKITARATFAFDPANPHNRKIVDLDLAPRNAQGRVEASSDVVILRPTDLSRGNGVILYDVVNRGNKLGIRNLNSVAGTAKANSIKTAEEAGNGFLMRQGYTVVWSGWQFDTPNQADLVKFTAPVIPGVTGLSREEFVFDKPGEKRTVELTYPAAPGHMQDARLTARVKEDAPRETLSGLSYRFVDPLHVEIDMPKGSDAGTIYEFIYTAADPVVSGAGFAAVRDVVSFLRHDPADRAGNANPLFNAGQPAIRYAYGHGISQSGRFLRDMLWEGFNTDEQGRVVFEALMPVVSGSRRAFVNARWAQPGRFSRQHEDHTFPDDQFPFSYGVMKDPVSGKTDGLFSACEASNNCPKVIQMDSDAEIRQARLSLVVTDTAGNDIKLPDNVREFYLVGIPHFAPGPVPKHVAACQAEYNPLDGNPAERALLVALDEWVRHGKPAPESRVPSVARGTWVKPDDAAIKGIAGLHDVGTHSQIKLLDQGSLPPKTGSAYPVLLPKPDADGFSIDGLKLPPVAVPRATYFGWNLRKAGYAEGDLCGLYGSTFPLPASAAASGGDTRVPLETRYPTPAAYVDAVRKAAAGLVADRLLLPDDADAAVKDAETGKLSRLAQ